ncbi:hypothetical protein ACJIZ3_015154 [Penstemon smallii]|uniref:Uncharacterized protein n=1 Tax=Penstemon smallii TaxID=265156 RepID=A0ABD3RQ18_9LAMI
MGSSVSVHKHPDSAMKLRLSFGSKIEKLLIPSPVKHKSDTVNNEDCTVDDVAVKPAQGSTAHFGSKDEDFFDSQPWLDSDCEDDFLSVNGDFTPSRGSTPVHHNFSIGNQQMNKALVMEATIGSVPEPSPPPDKKKRLSELFKESLQLDEPLSMAPTMVEAESTPYLSTVSSETTPIGVLRTEGKPVKSAQCCLPRLISIRSFSERKKRMTPERSVVV